MAETGLRLRLRPRTSQSSSLSGNGPGHDGLRRVAVDILRADLTDPCDVAQVKAQLTDTDVDYGALTTICSIRHAAQLDYPRRSKDRSLARLHGLSGCVERAKPAVSMMSLIRPPRSETAPVLEVAKARRAQLYVHAVDRVRGTLSSEWRVNSPMS